MAAQGIATVAINVVGHGGDPLGTLTVNQTIGSPVTFPAGGRSIDQNGDGAIGSTEGLGAAPPRGIINVRDGLQQTVADLMQLVRVIGGGMDVDGNGTPDLDSSRIYYFGESLGGIYGTIFLAVESSVRAGVPNVPGGPIIELLRLSPFNRPVLGFRLASRVPSLINVGGIEFNENMPLRNQPPVINNVPGAIEIQEFIERSEWATQAGNPVAYAPHLWKQPLTRRLAKSVIIQFAKGGMLSPNPRTTAMLRAGDLADRATFYRNDLAFADPVRNQTGMEVPKNPHDFLVLGFLPPPFGFPAIADISRSAQQQIAEFFASDGETVIDPDGPGPLFEVPIAGPLPEELNFIP
jgi:hypothetical protein